MNSMAVGIVELIFGAGGLVAGLTQRISRASMIIAVGLLMMGLAHFVSSGYTIYLPDIGGIIVLLGLGMTLGVLRRGRKRGGPNGQP